MDCGRFWIQEQVTIRMLERHEPATPALFQLSFLPGVFVFLPLKLPMVTRLLPGFGDFRASYLLIWCKPSKFISGIIQA
jgi:hypothetical protein